MNMDVPWAKGLEQKAETNLDNNPAGVSLHGLTVNVELSMGIS